MKVMFFIFHHDTMLPKALVHHMKYGKTIEEWKSKLWNTYSMDNYAVIKKDKLFLWYFKGIVIVIKCLMKNYNNKFYAIIVR